MAGRSRITNSILVVAGIAFFAIVAAIKLLNQGAILAEVPSVTAEYVGPSPHTKPVVVVFVHGIFGDRSTWGEQKTSFPEMLTTDPSLVSTVDGFVFEYYSPKFGPASNVSELAKQLKAAMEDHHVFEDHQRVAFLVHSMGGLIARRSLTLLSDPSKVAMVYFYATPTNGADITSLASTISSSPQLKSMLPLDSNESLQQIADDWLSRPALRTIPSYCAYETLPTDGIFVVTQASARALCNRLPEAMTANHIEMVKPFSRTDPRYSRFVTALKESAFEQPPPTNPATTGGAATSVDAPASREGGAPTAARGEFRVVVDGRLWNSVRSRVVVYDGRFSLLDRVRVFEPESRSAKVIYKVTGHDLVAAHLNFRGVPLNQGSVRGVAIEPDGSEFPISDAEGYDGLMKLVWTHMEMLKEGKGTYYLTVFDRAGRTFDLDLYNVEWSMWPNSTTISGGYAEPSSAASK